MFCCINILLQFAADCNGPNIKLNCKYACQGSFLCECLRARRGRGKGELGWGQGKRWVGGDEREWEEGWGGGAWWEVGEGWEWWGGGEGWGDERGEG